MDQRDSPTKKYLAVQLALSEAVRLLQLVLHSVSKYVLQTMLFLRKYNNQVRLMTKQTSFSVLHSTIQLIVDP